MRAADIAMKFGGLLVRVLGLRWSGPWSEESTFHMLPGKAAMNKYDAR